tara:strand:- start:439 stop:747 length:309 start_codon:yes stop_codon:yes gene_type:complete
MKLNRINPFIVTALVLLFALPLNSLAQNKINNIIKVNPYNIRAIKDNNEIKGYYLFYKEDKLKGKEYSYKLYAMRKRANAQIAHLVFADTQANAEKTKRAIF